MAACLLTGSLLPWTGGPVRSVAAFQQALAADVVSFVDERYVGDDALPTCETRRVIVPAARIPGARHFLVPTPAGLRDAYRIVADADLVSCHSFYLFHPLWLAELDLPKRAPYWFVPHGILDPVVAGRHRLLKTGYRVLARRFLAGAAATVFSTVAERDKALAQTTVPNPVVIPWPVSVSPVPLGMQNRQRIRELLGIPAEHRILVSVGRLDHIKRPLDLVRLFARACDTHWHCVLVGHEETITAQACREVARRAGIADRVHVVPGVTAKEAIGFTAAADLFASYSVKENFNNAAAEALAAGVPLLLSEGNDLAREILPTGAAWMLPEDRCQAARVLAECLSLPDDELRQRGEAGREWAARHLTFEEFRSRLRSLREDVGGGRA